MWTGAPVRDLTTCNRLARWSLNPADRDVLNSIRKQEWRVELLRLLEEYINVRILKCSILRRVEDAKKTIKGIKERNAPFAYEIVGPVKILPEDEEFPEILKYIDQALKLVAVIRDHDQFADLHDSAGAAWGECRLLMHLSVCRARMCQLELIGKGDPKNPDALNETPMGILSRAEASLRVSDSRRFRSDLAVVEIYRAEVVLVQAASQNISPLPDNLFGGKTINTFEDLVRCLDREDTAQFETREMLIPLFKEGQLREKVRKDLARVSSLVYDAMHFLDRAEPVLRERRRNVWWTTWFFERRLRCMAWLVWCSILEPDMPIPYLGTEAAMQNTASAADLILENAIRMVRVDSYRVATILDAYASCAKALRMRLLLGGRARNLHGREERMHKNVEKALEHLKNVSTKRDGGPQGPPQEEAAPKEGSEERETRNTEAVFWGVGTYIAEVKKRRTATEIELRNRVT